MPSPKKSSKKPAATSENALPATRLISLLAIGGVWLLLLASLISYHPADPPALGFGQPNDPPANWVGAFGARIAHEAYLMLGPGVWVVVTGLTVLLGGKLMGKETDQPVLRLVGLICMAVSISALLSMKWPGLLTGLEHSDSPAGPGGLIALFLTDQLSARFAGLGTFVILFIVLIVGATLAADHIVLGGLKGFAAVFERITDTKLPRPSLAFAGSFAGAFSRSATATPSKPQRKTRKPRSKAKRWNQAGDEWIDEDAGGLGGTETFDPEEHTVTEDDEAYEYVDEDGNPIDPEELDAYDDEVYEEEGEYEEYEDEDEDGAPQVYAEDAEADEQEQSFSQDDLRAKIKQLPINFAPKADLSEQTELFREVDLSGYEFPKLDLLDEPGAGSGETRLELVQEQGYVLESAMTEYGIDGEVVGIDSGPTITLYEVRLAPGTKVASLNRIASDLARSLKAHNVRIVANMAGKDTVGVEVPNLERETVTLRELMAVSAEKTKKMMLPMWLGKDASGNPLVHDLNTMPHMLIAGTTGSGKSVCMNAIIMSLLFTKRPDELKMVLVDPKMVEMAMYKDIPHLMCPVVTEMSKAAAILEWAVGKMDERYELLAEAGVRNIQSYNDLEEDDLRERMGAETEEDWAKVPKKLPYLVFIIDELADLMMTNKEVEAHIVRIAQKARAVGMHLILATQRPQANVVTGLIKGNMPCRVSFRVASKLDSRIVLDQGGAELLLGHGDMLFLNPKTSKVSRSQGTFIDDMEVRRTVKFLKNVAGPSFEPALVQLKGAAELEEMGERDELFDQAVEILLDSQRGSVSLLQRKLTIGYSRASRIIEELERCGVLGAHKTAQAREVLISREEWEAMKQVAMEDAGVIAAASDEDEEYEYEEAEDGDVPDEYDDEYTQ